MRSVKVRCSVFKGMFSDEAVIVVRRKGGGDREFIVPKMKVSGEFGGPGEVRANEFEHNSSKWVVLPTDYNDMLPVDDRDLIHG